MYKKSFELPFGSVKAFLLYSENHQHCWWFQKALALHRKLSERSEEPTIMVSHSITSMQEIEKNRYFNSSRARCASESFFDEPIGSAGNKP